MEKEALSELLSNSKIGVALYNWEDLSPQYENKLFSEWFPKVEKDNLGGRIPSLNIEKLKKKLLNGNTYSLEYEIKTKNRSKILKLDFTKSESSHIFIKTVDYTKEKELEYLLDSYSKLAERNRRQLEESLEVIKNQKVELIKTNSSLEREKNNIELRALQAIINPHFVSNCLASIQSFILDNDISNSVNYLSHFGKLMRLTFVQSFNDYISISEILLILRTYVSIEKIRINHEWDFEIIVDENIDIENSKMPPMLIQPFLENAIWHGINHKKSGGIITVTLHLVDEITLKCTVEDNGLGRKNTAKSKENKKATLLSLNVTGQRLDILWQEYVRKHQIRYTDLKSRDGTPSGTKVELLIPLDF